MINVELSNIWSCVSLPNLLSSEQALFEAHLKLRRNQPGFDDFLGWLGCGDAAVARVISGVERAADAVCRQSQPCESVKTHEREDVIAAYLTSGQFLDSFARSLMDRPNRLMKPAASA